MNQEIIQTKIIELALYYDIPLKIKFKGGEINNPLIVSAQGWWKKKLKNKSKKELDIFIDCIKEGFKKTAANPFPRNYDFKVCFDLCFDEILFPESQEKYIPLEEIKPLIKFDGEIEEEEFDLLKYLQYEEDNKNQPFCYDVLFGKYGVAGFKAVGEFKGEYAYNNNMELKHYDNVNWINVYYQENQNGL